MRTRYATDAPLGQIGGAGGILAHNLPGKSRLLLSLSYDSNGSLGVTCTLTMPPSATSPGISWIALLKLRDHEMAEDSGHAPQTFRFHLISNQ
jgi:hypothetical protein